MFPAPSFDALATLREIQAESVHELLGVPTMFIAMLSHPALRYVRLTSLRTGMMAGSPCRWRS